MRQIYKLRAEAWHDVALILAAIVEHSHNQLYGFTASLDQSFLLSIEPVVEIDTTIEPSKLRELIAGQEDCHTAAETLTLAADFTGIRVPIASYEPPRPAPRYFVVHVQEVRGERENSYTVKVIYVGTDTAENVALGARINTNSELDPDPFDRENFWFESSSIRVKFGKMTAEEITLGKFQQNEYLSEMVVDDDDIRRAIAYKSGAPSEEWWKEDESDWEEDED